LTTTPPTTTPVEIPKTREQDAAQWLQAYGIVPKVPTIRSSDAAMLQSEPFTYYLNRILGISDPLDSSVATRVGTWTHKCLELAMLGIPADAEASFVQALKERQELIATCLAARGVLPAGIAERQDAEMQEAMSAKAYFEAATKIKIPNTFLRDGFLSWVNSPGFLPLAVEKRLVWTTQLKNAPVPHLVNVIQPDILLFSKATDTIWGFDFKSTSVSPTKRLSCCPFEFQAQHNLAGLAANLPWLIEHFELSPNTRVGGFYHLALQKPAIFFGPGDRDSTIEHKTISRGPRKGQVDIVKHYTGEPVHANFINRCIDWMQGTGDYLDKADLRRVEPVINASIIRYEDFLYSEYMQRYWELANAACREHIPANYPRTEQGILSKYGTLTTYAPFYHAPIHEWPELIEQKGLQLKRRDDDLDNDVTIGLH